MSSKGKDSTVEHRIKMQVLKGGFCMPGRTNDLDGCIVCLGSVSSLHSVCQHALVTADLDLAYADKSAMCLHLIGVQDHLLVALQICPNVCG